MVLYEISLVFVALAIFGAIILPRLLADKPLTFPIIYVGLGFLLFNLPLGVEDPDPIEQVVLTEHLTELVVIIALMGAGLKLDRPFDWQTWVSSWRLLGITMPLTIVGVALLGWAVMGVLVPTAVLMGAVLAPTDPVLASDVQATEPTAEMDEEADPGTQEGTIRFALTSEAGLNDGLAFPFTHLAISLATVGAVSGGVGAGEGALLETLAGWFLVDVIYRIVVGVIAGYVVGKAVGYVIFSAPATTQLARMTEGAEALAATLLAYGATELLYGYGFIAVFVTALVLRHYEWEHAYYQTLHDFAVMIERLLMAAVLVLFGGTIAGGLLAPLTLETVVVGLTVVLVVRPLAGLIGLVGGPGTWGERAVIAGFGIRGIGSFYYLAFALNEASFQELQLLVAAPEIWALVGFVVLVSMVVHGLTAPTVMNSLDRWRQVQGGDGDADAQLH